MTARSATLVAAVVFPLIGCSDETPPDWVPEARQQSGQLGKQLVATLTEALSQEGPAGGVQVCHVEAPKIAERVSGNRFDVARTALRVRNPDNARDAWETSILRRFDARMAEGADPAGLEAWTVERVDGNRVGRYMKAIPVGPQCVVCHGDNIDPGLAETIDKLYPEDQATGFAPGELRGAFTVSVDLSADE